MTDSETYYLDADEDIYNRVDKIAADTLSLLKGPYIAGARLAARHVHQKSNRDGDGMPRYMTNQMPAVAVYTPDQSDEADDTLGSYEITVDMVVDIVAFAGNSDKAEDDAKTITWQARRLLRQIMDQEHNHLDRRFQEIAPNLMAQKMPVDVEELKQNRLWRYQNITLELGNTVAFSTYTAKNGWIADSASGFRLKIEFED